MRAQRRALRGVLGLARTQGPDAFDERLERRQRLAGQNEVHEHALALLLLRVLELAGATEHDRGDRRPGPLRKPARPRPQHLADVLLDALAREPALLDLARRLARDPALELSGFHRRPRASS